MSASLELGGGPGEQRESNLTTPGDRNTDLPGNVENWHTSKKDHSQTARLTWTNNGFRKRNMKRRVAENSKSRRAEVLALQDLGTIRLDCILLGPVVIESSFNSRCNQESCRATRKVASGWDFALSRAPGSMRQRVWPGAGNTRGYILYRPGEVGVDR